MKNMKAFVGSLGSEDGMDLRDYFAIHGPQPSEGSIEVQTKHDHNMNPHNYPNKPKLRSSKEIEADLRYEFADAMMEARSKKRAD